MSLVGYVSARAVQLLAAVRHRGRPLSDPERLLVSKVFHSSVNPDPVRIVEGVKGLLNISRRAYVIENTLFLPKPYLPARPALLVHELCHVWQFQNGGHGYISNSLHAQVFGDGYDLALGLRENRSWEQLNAEQQAMFIELGFIQGVLDTGRLILAGIDRTEALRVAVRQLRSGQGARFSDRK